MKSKMVLILWAILWSGVLVKGAEHGPKSTGFNRVENKRGTLFAIEDPKQNHVNGSECSGEIGDILGNIRNLMHNTNYPDTPLQAYIVLMNDAHQSEYISDRDKRIQFISRFTGSSGSVVITDREALLWTDSRYHLQAEMEIDENCWTLMKTGQENVPSMSGWLNSNLQPNSSVGIDPFVTSNTQFKSIGDQLSAKGHHLMSVEENLVDEVWWNRPERSQSKIVPFNIKYSGKSARAKINEIRQKLREDNAVGIIVTSLDDIAWILNLRGSDIEYNPVFFSYLILTQKQLVIFVDETKLTMETKIQLFNERVDYILRKYGDISSGIDELVNNTLGQIVISSDASQAIYQKIPDERRRVVSNMIADMKAVKNSVEALGLEQAHIRDGYAVVRYLHWLDSHIDKENITELSGAEKLAEFRGQLENYRGLSFETISCVGPHAAMAHYSPTPETASQITRDEIYLVDSGGQYWDGTTDITRTVHFGEPTSEESECFTRVLKGFIALVTSVFPRKTEMRYLDYVARRALWQVGLNYGHGTGHGVGAYLLVHEYPPSINSASAKILHKNMFTSDEPGFYKDGAFGIRIEDVIQVIEADIGNAFDGSGALTFKSITYVPLQTKLMDRSILTKEEVTFINDYNRRVFETLGPQLLENGLNDTFDWLRKETTEISFQL